MSDIEVLEALVRRIQMDACLGFGDLADACVKAEGPLKRLLEKESRAQAGEGSTFSGWYCAHCQRGVDGSEVTYNEQHQECGRVITDDAPPAPQPDKWVPTLDWAVKRCLALQQQGFERVRLDVLEATFSNAIEASRPNPSGEGGDNHER